MTTKFAGRLVETQLLYESCPVAKVCQVQAIDNSLLHLAEAGLLESV